MKDEALHGLRVGAAILCNRAEGEGVIAFPQASQRIPLA